VEMQADPSVNHPGKRKDFWEIRGFVPVLAAFLVAATCAVYVHEQGIVDAWAFLGVSCVTGVALWFIAFMFDSWLSRPTHGTSGGIGALYIWCAIRAVASVALIGCGLAGFLSYFAAYLATIIVCGILDTIFVFTSL
jgi:hypothetical protein